MFETLEIAMLKSVSSPRNIKDDGEINWVGVNHDVFKAIEAKFKDDVYFYDYINYRFAEDFAVSKKNYMDYVNRYLLEEA